jgi:protein phosphatase 2C family protein 2/3
MFYDDIIISEPEMMSVDLTEEDEFLVMASDGVWDVMNPEQAVRKVK